MNTRGLHLVLAPALKSTASTRLRRAGYFPFGESNQSQVPPRRRQSTSRASEPSLHGAVSPATPSLAWRSPPRELPCSSQARHPTPGLEQARLALASVCAARRCPRARKIRSRAVVPGIPATVSPARPSMTELRLTPFGAADAAGISPQGERKGWRPRACGLPGAGRARPNALGRSRGQGDLASARCASLGALARPAGGREPAQRARPQGESFFGQLSFKRKWPARRQPSGTGRCAEDTGAAGEWKLCFKRVRRQPRQSALRRSYAALRVTPRADTTARVIRGASCHD